MVHNFQKHESIKNLLFVLDASFKNLLQTHIRLVLLPQLEEIKLRYSTSLVDSLIIYLLK